MSDPAVNAKAPQVEDEEESATGSINLVLVYSLLAVAFAAAILFAVFIVWPFYIRR
jgi:hypothetical protein